MKILVDQNISFRLLARINSAFPEVEHVSAIGLTFANDYHIFSTARAEGFVAVLTQDEDFYNLLLEHGPPPKIVWLRTGNCSTAHLAAVVLQNAGLIQAFLQEAEQDCLEIYSK